MMLAGQTVMIATSDWKAVEYIEPSVPPTAEIAGIDLVTEGILTLNKCIEKYKK